MEPRPEPVSEAAWEAALATSPWGTFFQSPAWYRTVAITCGGHPEALGFRLADGVLAVVPRLLVRTRRGLVRQARCGVEGGYGGVLAPRALTEEEHLSLTAALCALHPDLLLVGDPHTPGAAAPAGQLAEVDATRVIPVLPAEAQAASFSAARRRHLRRARQAGLRVTIEAAPGPEAVADFYPIYAAHAARWSYTRWVRDERWFRVLLREGGEDLLLCRVWEGDRPIGFQLLACGAGAALQLHLATDPERNELNPGTLLIADSLAALHARGVSRFDCLASGRLESVAAFKESLGAQPIAFGRLARQGWLQRALGLVSSWRAGPRAA